MAAGLLLVVAAAALVVFAAAFVLLGFERIEAVPPVSDFVCLTVLAAVTGIESVIDGVLAAAGGAAQLAGDAGGVALPQPVAQSAITAARVLPIVLRIAIPPMSRCSRDDPAALP